MGENEFATEMRGHLFAVLVDWKAGNQVKRGGVSWSGVFFKEAISKDIFLFLFVWKKTLGGQKK